MIKLGEIFCGPGGFAEGAKKAKGFKHVWANDIDPDASRLSKNIIRTAKWFKAMFMKTLLKIE